MHQRLSLLSVFLWGLFPISGIAEDKPVARQQFLVVVGAAGNNDYQSKFATWAERWKTAVSQMQDAAYDEIGLVPEPGLSDKEQLEKKIGEFSDLQTSTLWIVLIGHGTFDRDVAKFNLRGPDVAASDLGRWCLSLKSPLIVIDCASSSGPFINRLSGKNRTIVTATKSGQEQNFARFGDFLSQAIADIRADLDHDDEVSLLEAFLNASDQVAKFYESEGRLATEHALIDDNGDAMGTPANLFQGTTATGGTNQTAQLDGQRSSRYTILRSDNAIEMTPEQQQARDGIEHQITQLKATKMQLRDDEYFQQLEGLMLQLGRLYRQIEAEMKPLASD